MSLESLAYLADIVGVGLIVASLVYVGRQLRQNTETMRQNAAGFYLGLQDRLMGTGARAHRNSATSMKWIAKG